MGTLILFLIVSLLSGVKSNPVVDAGESGNSWEWTTANETMDWDLDFDNLSVETKIVGGTYAAPREFPHQVSLNLTEEGGYSFCGGSIISPNLILTAAHCVKNTLRSSIKIIAGVTDLTLHDQHEQIRKAKSIYIHEQYDDTTLVHDIAIIELDASLQYNAFVRNIELPRENEKFSGHVTVSGWGKTEDGTFSNKLKKGKWPIYWNHACQKIYKKSKYPVTENHICAGVKGEDACQGDSGGPAICKRSRSESSNDNSAMVICGIVSFGNGCGRSPGVYARVASYIDWIEYAKNKIMTRKKCRSDYFNCASGTGCIPRAFLCDAQPDCETKWGAEDEQNCINFGSCQLFQFRCNNGRCLDEKNVCNGEDDCGDSSDEDKCPTTGSCGVNQHKCGFNGKCIPNSWKCDNEQDCDDGSDEDKCTIISNDHIDDSENEIESSSTCPTYFWRCGNGQCIYNRFKCDGDNDCNDGSDEVGC